MTSPSAHCIFRGSSPIGTFTGGLIRLISDVRAKHGRDAVNLSDCGKFMLPEEDLSDISDIENVDLRGIDSLTGEQLPCKLPLRG